LTGRIPATIAGIWTISFESELVGFRKKWSESGQNGGNPVQNSWSESGHSCHILASRPESSRSGQMAGIQSFKSPESRLVGFQQRWLDFDRWNPMKVIECCRIPTPAIFRRWSLLEREDRLCRLKDGRMRLPSEENYLRFYKA
jgi:hypothetical protein